MPSLAPSQPEIHTTSHLASVRLLADDLTGACDSAAAFLAAGHTVRVWLDLVARHPAAESVQAFNLGSRNLTPRHAWGTAGFAVRKMDKIEQTLMFKKVDSAGRGHLVLETLGTHSELRTAAVLFAPSFPVAGRTVRDGILHVADATGEQSTLALLPLFQKHARTTLITHPDQIPEAISAGFEVLLCDAVTQSDLEALAAFDHPNLLYAGSAGLARALVKHIHPETTDAVPLPRVERAMTICGTPHPLTQLQLKHLAKMHPHHPRVDIELEYAYHETIRAAFELHNPGALLLTGGDTALFVLTSLGAHSILLRGELEPGIPWGMIQGGVADNRIVITKSGGFGAIDALTNLVTNLIQGLA